MADRQTREVEGEHMIEFRRGITLTMAFKCRLQVA